MARTLRIAYVTPFGPEYSNIDGHLTERIDSWQSQGHVVRKFHYGSAARRSRSAARNLLTDVMSRRSLKQQLTAFSPAVVYARWNIPIPGLGRVLSARAPLIWDLHASELQESAARSLLRTAYARATRTLELNAAVGAVFVSTELATGPDFAAFRGRRHVSPNGVSASAHERPPRRPTTPPRIGYAVGNLLPWQGLDRLDRLADRCPQFEFRLCLPAALADVARRTVGSTNVMLLSPPDKSSYFAELSTWTVGLGTLGLDRSGREWASPLKVRDYIGLSMPVVTPYKDDVLHHLRDPMALYVAPEALESADFVERFHRFVADARTRVLSPATLEASSNATLEAARLAFLAALVSER